MIDLSRKGEIRRIVEIARKYGVKFAYSDGQPMSEANLLSRPPCVACGLPAKSPTKPFCDACKYGTNHSTRR